MSKHELKIRNTEGKDALNVGGVISYIARLFDRMSWVWEPSSALLLDAIVQPS
jgi:hypothetical protein